MDKTLKELKALREETEEHFRALLERAEQDLSRLGSEAQEIREALNTQGGDSIPPPVKEVLDRMTSLNESLVGTGRLLAEGLQEMMSLDNARSAELARQLTVLPLERMDLLFDELERRLETLESRLQRIE
jgi:hypothetical protein